MYNKQIPKTYEVMQTRRELQELSKRSTLIAIQDEINQYQEGNLTLQMALDGIKELSNSI